jgi:uncharacterized protein
VQFIDRLTRLVHAIRTDAASSAWGGWSNAYTGLGTDGDKGTGWTFTNPREWSVEQLAGLFEGDSIARKAVALVVEDALRQGFDLESNGDTTAGEEWLKKADRLFQFREKVERILTESRLYGGVAVIPMYMGGGDPKMPMNTAVPLRVASIQWAEPDAAVPLTWITELHDRQFGNPKTWAIQLNRGHAGGSFIDEIHHTRVRTVLAGIYTQRTRFGGGRRYVYWPKTVLHPILEGLRLYRSAMAGLGALLQDYGQGVYTVNALDSVITDGAEGAEKLRIWMRARDMMRSAINAIVLDNGIPGQTAPETFERKGTPTSELANLIDRFHALVSEATGIPITRLFGQAPSGLSTDDKSGTRSWYDLVQSYRDRQVEPFLRDMISILSKDPELGLPPPNFTIKWPSLYQYTPEEEANARKTVAESDNIYLTQGVADPKDVAEVRGQPDGWRQHLKPNAPDPMTSLVNQMAQGNVPLPPPPGAPVPPGVKPPNGLPPAGNPPGPPGGPPPNRPA